MNSGTPASSAPGPLESVGIRRSTAALTNVHSFASKKTGVYGVALAWVAEVPAVVDEVELRSQPAMLAIGTKATDLRRKVRLLSLDCLARRNLSMGKLPLIIRADPV